MLKPNHRRSLAVAVVFTLSFSALTPIAARTRSAFASAAGQDKKDKKKEEAKADNLAPSKQERQYQKIKDWSLNQYNTNQEFKDEVDEAYREAMRKHAELAYLINTRNPNSKLVTRDGDKITMEDTLYDNPLAQDYVNRVGQSLVPAGSNKLYAFKITLNPVPDARSLSTGTIYISSGLLSAVDNEAQLAYVLGHEIAHVEKEHWKEDVLVDHGLSEYNEKQQKKRTWMGLGISAGLGLIGASGAVGSTGSTVALLAAYAAVPTVLKLAYPNATVSWDKQQEDQADDLGLRYMLSRNYDPNEAPRFYANLRSLAQRDPRVRSGFMAHTTRIDERTQMVTSTLATLTSAGSLKAGLTIGAINLAQQAAEKQNSPPQSQTDSSKGIDPTRNTEKRAAAAERLITGELSPEVKAKLDNGELIGTTAEFEAVMAGLKRDNGISAYYFDMFQMARENLEESLRIRSNDPYAHYYYGKVLKLTARTSADKLHALGEFAQAVQYDGRRVLAEPHLFRALTMIERNDPTQIREITDSLKEYVSIYQREHSGALPPNMEVIYDYMQEAGEMAWTATPAVNVSTRGIEPIDTRANIGSRPAAAPTESQTPTAQPQPTQRTPQRRRP